MGRTIGVVQIPGFFQDLLSRLGVNRPQMPFTLDGDIVPVVIVESGIAFTASPSPPYRVTDVFTAGNQVAPGAGTRLADTGPLPVGAYSVMTITSSEEAALFEFVWRDATDAADLFRMRVSNILTSGPLIWKLDFRLLVENANERFVIENLNAGGVGNNYQSSILART